MFTINQLEYFIEVANQLSFTKAAESFFTNQATISRSISQLERQLGVKLFYRSTRKIELTEAGRLLLEYGEEWLSTRDEIVRNVQLASNNPTTELKLLGFNFYNDRVNSLIHNFELEHPDIQFTHERCRLTDVASILEKVDNQSVDIGIICSFQLNSYHGTNLEMIPLASDQIAVMLQQGHPIAIGKAYLTSADVISEKILCVKPIFKFINSQSPDLVPVDNIETLIARIRAGKGIGIFPRDFLTDYSRGCEVIDFYSDEGFPITFDYCLCYNVNSTNPNLKILCDWLLEKVSQNH